MNNIPRILKILQLYTKRQIYNNIISSLWMKDTHGHDAEHFLMIIFLPEILFQTQTFINFNLKHK